MTAQLLIGLGAGMLPPRGPFTFWLWLITLFTLADAAILVFYRKHLQAEFARPRRHWLYFIDLTGGRSAMMLLLASHI